ncbi:MAG TPA: RagB/SusD family nutrient uptake outer membrane protein [Chitinophagaceae bacterium]
MKKILLSITLVALLVSFNACNKLDLAPEDYFGSGNFWKNTAQVDGAMIGLHSQLRDFQFTFYALGELRGGTLKEGTGATGSSSLNSGALIRQDIRESAPGISSWAGLYRPIFDVNNFIFQVEKATYLSDTNKSYFLGQAYGLRAFYYFHLYRTFGRVPLATEPKVLANMPTSADQAYLPRAKTEKEVLDFIKSDVEKSVTSFNGDFTNKAQKALWSLGATLMLKAEVYLWSAKVKIDGAAPTTTSTDLAAAREALELVIPKYSLQSNYANVFAYNQKGNNEIILALRYAAGESTNFYGQFLYQASDNMTNFVDATGAALPADPLLLAGGGAIIRYEYKYGLFEKYDTAFDKRARATFLDFYRKPVTSATKFILLRKFLGTVVDGKRSFSEDVPIYRLAEAYLMLAEVKNKQGQSPATEMDIIRKRAYGVSPFPAFISGSFEENELAILAERDKELVGEGKRWYDLRRMQDASGEPLAFRKDLPLVGVLDKATETHKLLWPIDRATLTGDETLKNDQNPGY